MSLQKCETVTAPEQQNTLTPNFSLDDFLSDRVYEWLYEKKDNKFMLQILLSKVQLQAKALKFAGFMRMWNSYVESKSPRATIVGNNQTMFPGQPVQLECGQYVADEYGVSRLNERCVEVEVISHPLIPISRIRNIETGEERIELAYYQGCKQNWKTRIVHKDILSSPKQIVSLYSKGLNIHSENAKEVIKYLSFLESQNYDEIPTRSSVSRLGWADKSFFPYTGDLIYDGDGQQEKRIIQTINPSGIYQQWMNIARTARKESIPAKILLACSFASVLLRPLRRLNFWVHLHSSKSTIGKTVALMLAASVWGKPTSGGLLQSASNTGAAFEFLNKFLSDIPCFLDESQTTESSKISYSELIYRHCEGISKGRGNYRGTVRRQSEWHNIAMTTGEQPIIGNKDHAGALARLIDIPTESPLFSDPRTIAETVTDNYGWAGKEFVQALTQPDALKTIEAKYKEFLRLLEDDYHITPKQAESGAVIMAADFFANEIIFKDKRSLTAMELAPYLKTNSQIDMNERLHEQIKGILIQHEINFRTDDNDKQPPRDQWGKITTENGTVHWYVIRPKLVQILDELGGDFSAYYKWGINHGIIISHDTPSDKHQDKKIRLGSSPVRCVDFLLDSEAETKSETNPAGLIQNPASDCTQIEDIDLPF